MSGISTFETAGGSALRPQCPAQVVQTGLALSGHGCLGHPHLEVWVPGEPENCYRSCQFGCHPENASLGQPSVSNRKEAVNMYIKMLPLSAAALFVLIFAAAQAVAQKKYDPGATDSEIKIGNIMPYTGKFSEYGAIGRAEAAYFQMINDKGGVNGRKINFISVDSSSDSSKSVALVHQLVEEDQVLLTVGIWGSSSNLAIRPYLNEKNVPQLFVDAEDSAFDDPSHFPWTMAFQASKRTEGLVYAKYILQNRPSAKVAILYAGDPSGQEWLLGIRDGLGKKASAMIVKELSFEYSDPATLDAQIVALKSSGADVFMNLAVGRFATQAIRKAYDIDWHPLQFIPNASLSIAAFLDPAGLKKAAGIIANARSKGWLKPQSKQDPAVRAFLEWMKKYNAAASIRDANNVYGYEVAQTLVEVLKRCGDDLTRANVMKQAASLDLELGMLNPGIRITTSPTDYRPIKQLFLIRFDGQDWVTLGKPIGN
jgi:branched-chain amino acid transport system substrate-binding protein